MSDKKIAAPERAACTSSRAFPLLGRDRSASRRGSRRRSARIRVAVAHAILSSRAKLVLSSRAKLVLSSRAKSRDLLFRSLVLSSRAKSRDLLVRSLVLSSRAKSGDLLFRSFVLSSRAKSRDLLFRSLVLSSRAKSRDLLFRSSVFASKAIRTATPARHQLRVSPKRPIHNRPASSPNSSHRARARLGGSSIGSSVRRNVPQ